MPAIPEAFYHHLVLDPGNWLLRGVMADWCEEHGLLDRAGCLRWMIRHQKRPYHPCPADLVVPAGEAIRCGAGRQLDPANGGEMPAGWDFGLFTWFNAETVAPDLGDQESDLPAAIYRHLRGSEEAHHKSYRALVEAEEDFQAAWLRALGEGWCPDAR